MAKLRCNVCGKEVSSNIKEDVIVRAWIECPECANSNEECYPNQCKDCNDEGCGQG